jgi:translation initiation factor 1 (eIF-1/SUI1)
MVNGQFKCLGSIQSLKSKFGKGYTLIVKCKKINIQDDEMAKVEEFIAANIKFAKVKGELF